MPEKDAFLDFVALKAKEINKVFILDSGEGNEFLDSQTGWNIEDLSGWLIPYSLREQLILEKRDGRVHDLFSEFYVFAKWFHTEEGELAIDFKSY